MASNSRGRRTDVQTGRTDKHLVLGLVSDGFAFSLSVSPSGWEHSREHRGRERKRPWEARAICIPNDRMTFARCIKMPLIDGARENTFGGLARCSIKPTDPRRSFAPLDHLGDFSFRLYTLYIRAETEVSNSQHTIAFTLNYEPNSRLEF